MKKIIPILTLVITVSNFAQDYKFGKVSKEEVQEKFYPLDSTADAAYLYRKRRTYFDYNQGFSIKTEIHERIKIYTKEGFNKATKSITYYKPDSGENETVSSIKGYTFNLEQGKIIKEKLSKSNIFKEKINKYRSRKKITMPSVKKGTVIEIKYSISSPYYTSIDDLQFQYSIPVKKINYKVELPEYFVFNKRGKGYYFVPMKKTVKNGRIGSLNCSIDVFEFEGNYIPALKDNEPFVSSVNEYRGGLKFELTQTNFVAVGGGLKNYSTDWSDVSKQIYKSSSFGAELNKSNYYKNDLEAILATSKTTSDKIAAIFQFVKSKVKWNGFYSKYAEKGVRKAYKENLGNVADINLMLTSMLRSAGLNAAPVLVSTRGNGVPLFPTLDGFDYVISMVKFPNNSYVLLDATEPYSLPNILPTRVLNWNGRVVNKNGSSSWVKLTPSKPAIEENLLMVKITDDLILEGLGRTKYDNLNALNYRKNYIHLKKEALITKFEEKNNVEIEDFKILNKIKIGKPISRNVKFLSEDLIEEINGKLYIEPLLFLAQHTNPFKLEERKFPVDFATPWKDTNTVSIQIPECYSVASLPETLAIGLPENLGVFKYQVTQAGGKIKTRSILQFNQAIITPQYYAALKDFYGQLVKKQSEKIVLVKKIK